MARSSRFLLCDVGMVQKVKVAGDYDPGFGIYQVRCIAVKGENLVAGVKTNVGVWLCV